jgi:hypothetical protein
MAIVALGFAPAVHGATYYLSPTGSDSAAGTSETAPWKSWSKVLSSAKRLKPGDTVILLDGTYTNDTTGLPRIICGVNANSGAAQAPITVRAKNPRYAFILGDGAGPTLALRSCAWWSIDGLHIESQDNARHTAPDAPVVQFYATQNSVIRNSIVRHPNRYGNNSAIEQYGGSHDNLLEDNEVLFFHRNGIDSSCDNCHHITVRRNYVNPQHARAAGLPGNKTGPNDAITVYWWDDSLFENNVVEGEGTYNGIVDCGERNRFFGNVSLRNSNGFLATHGDNEAENATAHSLDGVWVDNVAVDNTNNGFLARTAMNARVIGLTVYGGAGNGVIADNPYDARRPNAATACNNRPCIHHHSPGLTVMNALVVNTSGGFAVANVSEFEKRMFSFSHGWACVRGTWRAGTDQRDTASTPPDPPGSVDPQLGSCRVFIPDASPMKHKGKDGADVGANVLYRYQDGVLTTTPLWDPASGEFPHGPVIAGVNDVAGQNAFDVHIRLNVNANGCQLPRWYGGRP